jgi:hypothetical protein
MLAMVAIYEGVRSNCCTIKGTMTARAISSSDAFPVRIEVAF